MTFNSLAFLIFLPTVVILFFILPHRFRWILLLVASYYAYMSWNPWLIFLILATTVVSYLAGIFIPKVKSVAGKKALLWVTIIVCLGILIFFKYFNFLLASVIDFLNLFSMNIRSISLDIILPIGISFYTFQTLSYVIDVYRGKFPPEKHFGYYALYVSFFPQLVAGPIERPENLLPQLKKEQKLNKEDLLAGAQLLATGFFRKCVVADFCGLFVDHAFSNIAASNTLSLLAAGALFMVQLYCDFGGYSEIAAGASRLMGIKLSVNFDRPFRETTLSRTMRKWHMTLTSWFRDYVYISLGGNRKGKVRQILNVFIVFVLCGLWHGANWTFVVWGLFSAAGMSIEALITKPVRNFAAKHNINYHRPWIDAIRRAWVFLILTFSAFLFRAQNIAEAGFIYYQLFNSFGFGFDYLRAAMTSLNIKVIDLVQLALILAIMFKLYDLAYDDSFIEKDETLPTVNKNPYFKNVILCLMVVAVALGWFMLISRDAVSAFVYFQF
ncbi:MAG TPA: MBOAT family protein [Erysipelotrichaceae bacterium]|nr:MBOAT family protein [Erysipelotrichaceae bacterium]